MEEDGFDLDLVGFTDEELEELLRDPEETREGLIAIDTRALKITARWPVAPAGQPVSIAMDRQSRRLFSSSARAIPPCSSS